MKFTKALLFFFILTSCSTNHEYLSETSILLNKGNLNIREIVKDPEYLNLKQNGDYYFVQIDKLIKTPEYIFILDLTGSHYVYVFNKGGDFITRIGNIGEGPNEYRRLSDFDISESGEVILLDRQKKRLLHYNVEGIFLKGENFDFRATTFMEIKNGYLFGISIESEVSDLDGFQIIKTDFNFNVEDKFLEYPDGFRDIKFNTGLFTKAKNDIFYHKPVSDFLLKFNEEGNLISQFTFQIENPDEFEEFKLDYEKLANLRSSKDYKYLNSSPIIFNDLLLGIGFSGNSKALFLNQMSKQEGNIILMKENNFDHRNVNFPLFNYENEVLVSFIDYELYEIDEAKEKIPNHVISHLADGGTTLLFFRLK